MVCSAPKWKLVMLSSIHFAYSFLYWFIIPVLVISALYFYFITKRPYYQYPLSGLLARKGLSVAPTHVRVFTALRVLVFILLLFLIGKPQLVDHRSSILLDGIDIMMVLDVSGSMQFPDYDKKSRLQVAKEEALAFIDKRNNDAIGLVIFGNDALSRVPLTLDKKIIHDMISSLEIGIINHQGTVLCTAIITAANRLKKSDAKSKIMIVLTDGEPTPNDASPDTAIKIAQQLGIKIYTIGIGNEEEFFMDPFYGLIQKPKLNKGLLTKIAHETGGKFFLANNTQDMREIYNTIDSLEKTSHETSLYNHYYDIFVPFIWIILFLLVGELLLSSTIWFGL